jgi:hypothetical protein
MGWLFLLRLYVVSTGQLVDAIIMRGCLYCDIFDGEEHG